MKATFDHNSRKQIVKQIDSLQIDGQIVCRQIDRWVGRFVGRQVGVGGTGRQVGVGGLQVGRYRRYWQVVDIYEVRQIVMQVQYICIKLGRQVDRQADRYVGIQYICIQLGRQVDRQRDMDILTDRK